MTIKTHSPQILIDSNDSNAENPLWHPHHQYLYWTDIPCGEMFRYYPQTDTYERIYNGEPVGGFTIQEDGSLLLFKFRGTVEIWNEGEITTVIDSIPEAKDTRFNDAIADPEGRVYSGIIATENNEGKLYRINLDGSYDVVADDILLPNGMGFDRDYTCLYFTDSERRTIYRFDYDRATGNLSDRQVLIEIPENEGVPDGMTVDSENYIWSARWDGGHLHRYSPDGQEVMRISLPTGKVSCVTFGGESYDRMFISTARDGNKCVSFQEKWLPDNPAGDIFHLQTGIKGRPELLSRICLS